MSDTAQGAAGDRSNVLALVAAAVLFVVGAVLLVGAGRIVLFHPDRLTQPLSELVAVFVGGLAVVYAGVIVSQSR
jgi:hypothetical protein